CYDFIERNGTAPIDHLACQLLRARPRALQRHQQARLHLSLGAIHLRLVRSLSHRVDFIHYDTHELSYIGGIGAGIESKQTAIGVRRVEAVDRIAESALLAHLLKEPRGHAAAEHICENLETVETGIAMRQPIHGERDMNLLELPRLDAGPAD